MARHKTPRPTDGEIAILEVLWNRGASTVRQVQETLELVRPTAYTTALKMLQIMTEKGLVERDVSSKTHVYTPATSEQETQHQLATDLATRAFGGSAAKLVMRALEANPASSEELAEIRRLIDEMDDERNPA